MIHIFYNVEERYAPEYWRCDETSLSKKNEILSYTQNDRLSTITAPRTAQFAFVARDGNMIRWK